jgi:HSP20 family protein
MAMAQTERRIAAEASGLGRHLAVVRRDMSGADSWLARALSSLESDVHHSDSWLTPRVDIEQRESEWVVDVELAGVKKDDVSVQVERGLLTVTADITEPERKGVLRHRSRRYGVRTFTVQLPSEVSDDAVTAMLEDGILRISVPTDPPATVTKVEVQ